MLLLIERAVTKFYNNNKKEFESFRDRINVAIETATLYCRTNQQKTKIEKEKLLPKTNKNDVR